MSVVAVEAEIGALNDFILEAQQSKHTSRRLSNTEIVEGFTEKWRVLLGALMGSPEEQSLPGAYADDARRLVQHLCTELEEFSSCLAVFEARVIPPPRRI